MFELVNETRDMQDTSRGLEWAFLGTGDRGALNAAVLIVDGIAYPYDYRVDYNADVTPHRLEMALLGLGSTLIGAENGFSPVRFRSDDHRDHIRRLVAEATLTWEPGGKGFRDRTFDKQFKAGGTMFTLEDSRLVERKVGGR